MLLLNGKGIITCNQRTTNTTLIIKVVKKKAYFNHKYKCYLKATQEPITIVKKITLDLSLFLLRIKGYKNMPNKGIIYQRHRGMQT